jgi:hypothetical protein
MKKVISISLLPDIIFKINTSAESKNYTKKLAIENSMSFFISDKKTHDILLMKLLLNGHFTTIKELDLQRIPRFTKISIMDHEPTNISPLIRHAHALPFAEEKTKKAYEEAITFLIDFCVKLPVEKNYNKQEVKTQTNPITLEIWPNHSLGHSFLGNKTMFEQLINTAHEKQQLNRITPYDGVASLSTVLDTIKDCKTRLNLSNHHTALLLAPVFAHHKYEGNYPRELAESKELPKKAINEAIRLLDNELSYLTLETNAPEAFVLFLVKRDPIQYLEALRCAVKYNKAETVFMKLENHESALVSILSWVTNDTNLWKQNHLDEVVQLMEDAYPSQRDFIKLNFRTELEKTMSGNSTIEKALRPMANIIFDPEKKLEKLVKDTPYNKEKASAFLNRVKQWENCIDNCKKLIAKGSEASTRKKLFNNALETLKNERLANEAATALATARLTAPAAFTEADLNTETNNTASEGYKKSARKRSKNKNKGHNPSTNKPSDNLVKNSTPTLFEQEQGADQASKVVEWYEDRPENIHTVGGIGSEASSSSGDKNSETGQQSKKLSPERSQKRVPQSVVQKPKPTQPELFKAFNITHDPEINEHTRTITYATETGHVHLSLKDHKLQPTAKFAAYKQKGIDILINVIRVSDTNTVTVSFKE